MPIWPFKILRRPVRKNVDININSPIVPNFIKSMAATGFGSEKVHESTKIIFVEVDLSSYKFNTISFLRLNKIKNKITKDNFELLMMCTYICFEVSGIRYCYNALTDYFEEYSNERCI